MPNGQENAVNALRRAALLAQKAGLTESQVQEALKSISQPQPDVAGHREITSKMEEAKVTNNTGEVARFSDGTTVRRQRPDVNIDSPNPSFKNIYRGNLQPQIFKKVFAVGLTVSETLAGLKNPGSVDGAPVDKQPAKVPSISFERLVPKNLKE